MKLEHIAVNVSDPVAASRWYTEHLGLEIVRAATTAPFAHFLSDGAGGVIEIYNNPNGAVPEYQEMNPFTLHFAFISMGLEDDLERLYGAGATKVGEIDTTPAGDRLVFLRDPWGVPLQLVERAQPLV